MPLLRLLLLFAPILVPQDEFRDRRDKLRKALPQSAILLYGAGERDYHDLRSGFVQEPNFYYLTGWNQPGAVLLILPEEPREILFLPEHDERRERYDGPRLAASDADAVRATGFGAVLSVNRLDQELSRYRDSVTRWHTIKSQTEKIGQMLGVQATDLGPELAALRARKSSREIDLMQRSIDASIEGHFAAWKRVRPGVTEYQAAAAFTGAVLDHGCERNAYPPIAGSGAKSVILHYNNNGRKMSTGELVLMDMGAECAYYAADLTRTVPVSGKFSARQRELYQAVLGAQKAAIAAVKPGVSMQTLTRVAKAYLDQHGSLGKYFTHDIGHHVGLEVHDPGPTSELEPGMVITIEPGVYLPEESTGIRIEDMVLVTANGARVLSSSLPREIADIEKRLAK